MTINGFDPKMAQNSAEGKDLVQFKRQMISLKNRLSGDETKEDKLQDACKKFEAIFMGKIWKQMRKTVSKSGYLQNNYEDQYLSMFDKEFSEKLASGGGIGLGDMLYNQLRSKLEDASRETLPGTGNSTALKTLDEVNRSGSVNGAPQTEKVADKDGKPGIPLPKPGIELNAEEFGVGGPAIRNMVRARAAEEEPQKAKPEPGEKEFLSRTEAMAKIDELARKIEMEHEKTVYGVGVTAEEIGSKLASSS